MSSSNNKPTGDNWAIRIILAICFGVIFGVLIFGCQTTHAKPAVVFYGDPPNEGNVLFVCGWVGEYSDEVPMKCIPYTAFSEQLAKDRAKHEL